MKHSLVRGALSLTLLFVLCLEKDVAFARCSGAITKSQQEGFRHFFAPPFEAGLTHVGIQVTEENFHKPVSREELAQLSEGQQLFIAAPKNLSSGQAEIFNGWLNDNAQGTVPGWLSAATGTVAPAGWMALSADALLQLFNQAGDSGRLSLANLAGTVTEGGLVTVLHRYVKVDNDEIRYVWAYAYTANINRKRVTTILSSCDAKAIVQ